MSRVWFATELETAATFWRILRRDGVTLGFTSHDHDLWLDGVLHRASPGMLPSSIRRSAGFEPDSAEVSGALSHDSILASDLADGRFDGARIVVGVVDWETAERQVLYRGAIGAITEEDNRFTAELASRKEELALDPVPRTSPACRAAFCGPGCNLNPAAYSHDVVLTGLDAPTNSVTLGGAPAAGACLYGSVRWLDGPHAGRAMRVLAGAGAGLVLDTPLDPGLAAGLRAVLREGCDHTFATCASRFGNGVNFQGEPFLPGNDLLTRYPAPSS